MESRRDQVTSILSEEWNVAMEDIEKLASQFDDIDNRLAKLSNGDEVPLEELHVDIKHALINEYQ